MKRYKGAAKAIRDVNVLAYAYNHPQKNQTEIGKAFGLAQNTISDILQSFPKYDEMMAEAHRKMVNTLGNSNAP